MMDPTVPAYVNPDVGPVGTYALVIGVSEYPHLAGGANPAPNTYGLEQLTVSALTAYRFFEWIQAIYQYSAAPIAKCWLLLSPAPDELAYEPRLAGHVQATMANCVAAVEAWFATLQSLSAVAARESRTVFFFSGHGVQRNEGQLLLLPTDYLRPPTRSVSEALDTRNLRIGLEEVPRGEDLFFVDACRINPPEMNKLELTPRAILNARYTSSLNPDRLAPVLYAASSGFAAWQPPKPEDGISCYGHALIEGLLRQVEPSWPRCEHHPSTHLRLFDLFRFMKGRVTELLRDGGSVVKHPIELGPIRDDLCITEVLSPVPESQGISGAPTPSPPDNHEEGPTTMPIAAPPENGRRIKRNLVAKSLRESLAARAQVPLYEVATRTAELHPQRGLVLEQAEIGPAGVPTPSGDLYPLFRSERVTDAWHGSRGYRLDQQAVTEAAFVLHHVDRARLAGSNMQQQIRIVLSFENAGTHWIELTIPEKRTPAFALAFPPELAQDADRERQPRFLVEMTRDLGGEYAVEVALSADNTPPLRAAANIWEKYRDMDLHETLTAIEQLAIEQVLREKVESPLAALVSALVLVRTQHGARRKEWLHNLAKWYPGLPDAAVFAIEQDRREGAWEAPPAEWSAPLLRLQDRILPMTNYGLRLAADQVSEALERFREVPELERDLLQRLERLERLDERLRDALRQLHGRGLFSVFAGREVSAGLVLPRQEQELVATTMSVA